MANDFTPGDLAGKQPSGRIFAAAETDEPKINLDEEIEKNIRIKTMPRKFKVSADDSSPKTTLVGAIIMVVGILVLAAAVYLAYIFLINPQGNKQPPAAEKTPVSPTASTPVPSPSPATTQTNVNVPDAPVAATSTPVTATPASTSTSTPPVKSVATSSTPISGVPNGAITTAGLSAAEKALFELDLNKFDFDGDGYGDQSEVINLYNPDGLGKITDNAHIGVYQNVVGKYSIFYPKNWRIQSLENGDTLLFTAADNSLIEIISEPNVQKQSIKDWYNAQFADGIVTDSSLAAKDGWQGLFQKDKQIFYAADNAKNKIYTISYVPGGSNLDYYNIFLMMINSFTVK
jgi:hypothetical protein